MKELKNVLITGDTTGMKFVHIERLTINLNQSFDHSTMQNDQRQIVEKKVGSSIVDNPKG
jgi:pyrrolidone-carboxylate peptidase